MDTDQEIKHRANQIKRIKKFGIRSVNRVVTCEYGRSKWAKKAKQKQDYLLTLKPIIDNPFRANKSNKLVLNEDILITERQEAVGGGKFVSIFNKETYLGTCEKCPDQCGVDESLINKMREYNAKNKQTTPIF